MWKSSSSNDQSPGLRRELVPRQPLRLLEPETLGIGFGEIVQLGELARADAGIEAVGNG